jgi:hypothetical protein
MCIEQTNKQKHILFCIKRNTLKKFNLANALNHLININFLWVQHKTITINAKFLHWGGYQVSSSHFPLSLMEIGAIMQTAANIEWTKNSTLHTTLAIKIKLWGRECFPLPCSFTSVHTVTSWCQTIVWLYFFCYISLPVTYCCCQFGIFFHLMAATNNQHRNFCMVVPKQLHSIRRNRPKHRVPEYYQTMNLWLSNHSRHRSQEEL